MALTWIWAEKCLPAVVTRAAPTRQDFGTSCLAAPIESLFVCIWKGLHFLGLRRIEWAIVGLDA